MGLLDFQQAFANFATFPMLKNYDQDLVEEKKLIRGLDAAAAGEFGAEQTLAKIAKTSILQLRQLPDFEELRPGSCGREETYKLPTGIHQLRQLPNVENYGQDLVEEKKLIRANGKARKNLLLLFNHRNFHRPSSFHHATMGLLDFQQAFGNFTNFPMLKNYGQDLVEEKKFIRGLVAPAAGKFDMEQTLSKIAKRRIRQLRQVPDVENYGQDLVEEKKLISGLDVAAAGEFGMEQTPSKIAKTRGLDAAAAGEFGAKQTLAFAIFPMLKNYGQDLVEEKKLIRKHLLFVECADALSDILCANHRDSSAELPPWSSLSRHRLTDPHLPRAVGALVASGVRLREGCESGFGVKLASVDLEKSRGDSHLTVDQLFLGLLEDSQIKDLLKDAGISDIARVRAEVEKLHGNSEVRKGENVSQDGDTKFQVLKTYGRGLVEIAGKLNLDIIVEHSGFILSVIDLVISILSWQFKNNPVLVGEFLQEVVEGLAQRIARGHVPSNLLDVHFVALDMSALIAGVKDHSEFQDRVKAVLEEVEEAKGKVILFIDKIHLVLGAGEAEGTLDDANLFKPMLARGQLRCIGTTSFEDYRKYIDKDSVLKSLIASLADGQNWDVDFTNTVIIMTSNLTRTEKDSPLQIAREILIDEVRQHFEPEDLNRFDEIVIFDPLSPT
ncbi:hypothetical protein ZIOFF_038047 [Zingiber officinale]|uniref:SMAX1-like nucleotide binding domain-containing protein n=1 Tax=Zingiber officinale TaxID=94328 RepID=A0A8J5GT55_ZINOF|nr:hypothetical protein ZIOFF_038047 [Zingiber officinale]